MIVKLVNLFKDPEGVKRSGTTEFKTLSEGKREFNRVVDMTENLMSCKTSWEYTPYDEIRLVTNGDKPRTLLLWRREDYE